MLMETVRLLDSYRIAVAHDEHAIRLLSLLQRDGAQTDAALATEAHVGLLETRNKLTELFRANFVRILEDFRYAATAMAEQVMASIGVADAVGSDAIASSKLQNVDKNLLFTFFSDRENESATWRRYLAASAKSAKQIEKNANLSEETSARLWYATLLGVDPTTRELGPDLVCKRMYEHADLKTGNMLIEFKHVAHRCRVAHKDRSRSNEFWATGKHTGSHADMEVTLALTLTRLLASAIAQQSDEGLAAANGRDVNDITRSALKEWTRSFEDAFSISIEPHLGWGSNHANTVETLCSTFPFAPITRGILVPDQRAPQTNRLRITSILESVEKYLRDSGVEEAERHEASVVTKRIQELLAIAGKTPAR
jgi:hypothetical protein